MTVTDSAHTATGPGASVSVCMATFNGGKHVREQVDSILAERQAQDELVVSDDGSTDDTLQILRSYGSSLRIVGAKRAGGVVRNFSRALEHARGELILLADQDDYWLPGRLQRLRDELGSCELVYSNAWVVDEQLQSSGVTLFDQLRPAPGFWRNLVRTSSFVGCCMAFRRSLLDRVLPLPDSTPWHDWLIGLVASLRGQVRQVDTPLLLYRRHSGNVSLTGANSRNGPLRKIQLRVQVLHALVICMWRSRRLQS